MPKALLHAFCPPREDRFISIVGGKGALVWDDRGNEYVDGIASLWYVNIGHGREDMAEAIATQARTLASYMTFHPFTNPWADEAAARIAALSPFPDGRVFLCTSGSEAVDTAIKLARIAQREAGH
jgi:adenosylmethionine-8-amino-7-oxononanoate aminotransferase